LLNGKSCRDKAKTAYFVLPVINAQKSLEIAKRNKGMSGRVLYPGFIVHRYRVRAI
jgi:hypothetical protein